MQKSWDRMVCQKVYNELLSTEDDFNQARLRSLSLKNASDWLKSIPSFKIGCRLTDEETRLCVALRLGTVTCSQHTCKCGLTTDQYGKHCFSCKRNNGKSSRHTMVNNIVIKALQASGTPCLIEPTNLALSNGLRPDGVTLIPFSRGKPLVWDVTFPHPLTASHLVNFQPGRTAENAERLKSQKYMCLNARYFFWPNSNCNARRLWTFG